MIQGLILCNPGAARTALQWICRECAAVWCATRCCPAASAASTTSAAPTVLADPVDPVDLAASGASAASDASDASAFPPAVMHADALVASFERELVMRRVVAAELQYGAVDEQKVAPPVSHTHSYLPIHPHLGRAQPHGWLLNWRGHRAMNLRPLATAREDHRSRPRARCVGVRGCWAGPKPEEADLAGRPPLSLVSE